jgi:hypothetical protein
VKETIAVTAAAVVGSEEWEMSAVPGVKGTAVGRRMHHPEYQ